MTVLEVRLCVSHLVVYVLCTSRVSLSLNFKYAHYTLS
jgi:hypothetical protein